MQPIAARRALADSALALLLACLMAVALWTPWPRPRLAGDAAALVMGAVGVLALITHWSRLKRAANALDRSARGWMGLAVLLCPLGGAAALLLLSWQLPVRRTALAR